MQTTPKECDKNFEISGTVEEMRQNSGLAHFTTRYGRS
jgi:hypothetical protein